MSDAPNAVGLVYIAAFGLDEGESLGALAAQGPPTPALAHLDIDAVQQPVAASVFQDVMGVPARKSLPSWFLVATADEAIPPEGERQFAARMGATAIELASSHVAMVSPGTPRCQSSGAYGVVSRSARRPDSGCASPWPTAPRSALRAA